MLYTMSSREPPASSRISLMFSMTCRVCAPASPSPIRFPDASSANMPAVQTNWPDLYPGE